MKKHRHILSWVFPASLSACLMMVSLPVTAQQSVEPIENVTAVSNLNVQPPIAMPTAQNQGREAAPGAVSPFSKAANHPAGPANEGVRYPADLENQGGPTVESAESHAVFLNPTSQCAPNTCWGDPIGFLRDLSRSQFIDISNQYVNSNAPGRYPDGANYYFPGYTPSAGAGKPFTNLDMAIAAYSVAAHTGGFGTGHIYHLFLVPGQDVCFDNTFSVCYSPDNMKTWSFCAYHSAAADSAGNVVLYTVEPYQGVAGCSVRPGTPNGELVDSTNNVLSHETFETITDPLGSAWWNSLDNGVYGEEIGDECSFLYFTSTAVYFDPSIVRLNHKLYAAQPEYNNAVHACTTMPAD